MKTQKADSTPTTSPAARQFILPAEWSPHRTTWLAWPHQKADWPGKFEAIPWVYAEVVRHLVRGGERVGILARDSRMCNQIRALLGRAHVALDRVRVFVVPTDRSWTRDTAPLVVRTLHGERLALCFGFNGWAKYANHKRDAKVAAKIAELAGLDCHRPQLGSKSFVLEGGAIDVDGEGTLLVTEECLLSRVQSRNPGSRRPDIERALAEALGARTILWLGRGIVGDDTHGHIDDLARFVAPGKVVLATEPNPKDANYRRLAENRERLEGQRDALGRRLEVIALPMPSPLYFAGQRLPASYANFYIANRAVLVPTFDDPRDRLALGLLAELFPDRGVVGIHAGDLIWGLGTIHCMTQQEVA